jgi:hypothetical protein
MATEIEETFASHLVARVLVEFVQALLAELQALLAELQERNQ